MNGLHGIIFSYEKRNDLRELGEIRSASSIPFGGRYRAVDFALSNLVVSVYNLIPLVKLDGYWFLSAVLQVNNLMDKGFLMAYATFFHRNTLPELRMPAGQRRLLAGYGVAALLFKPLFWGYNLYAISTHLPVEDWVKWGLLCVGVAIMASDFYRTLRHAGGMIRQDYRRLTQMM